MGSPLGGVLPPAGLHGGSSSFWTKYAGASEQVQRKVAVARLGDRDSAPSRTAVPRGQARDSASLSISEHEANPCAYSVKLIMHCLESQNSSHGGARIRSPIPPGATAAVNVRGASTCAHNLSAAPRPAAHHRAGHNFPLHHRIRRCRRRCMGRRRPPLRPRDPAAGMWHPRHVPPLSRRASPGPPPAMMSGRYAGEAAFPAHLPFPALRYFLARLRSRRREETLGDTYGLVVGIFLAIHVIIYACTCAATGAQLLLRRPAAPASHSSLYTACSSASRLQRLLQDRDPVSEAERDALRLGADANVALD